jgi:chromosome transmission fidelity protein 4
MAAMGTIGAAFASPITKEGGETVPSQVFYRPFDSWAPNSDWTVNLAKGEEATAIAVGATFVAVATSARFLRIFSFSGVQLTVISLMGDAVCMSGQDNMLGVVYHTPASPSLAGDQVCLISQYSDLSANNSYIRSISQT